MRRSPMPRSARMPDACHAGGCAGSNRRDRAPPGWPRLPVGEIGYALDNSGNCRLRAKVALTLAGQIKSLFLFVYAIPAGVAKVQSSPSIPQSLVTVPFGTPGGHQADVPRCRQAPKQR
jgi:hypothetical protein